MQIITRKIGLWFQDKEGILSRGLMSSVGYYNFEIVTISRIAFFLNTKKNVTIVTNTYYSKF